MRLKPKKAIPTMVQIPLERTEGEQASRLQVIAIKPNKILPKQAIIALSPEYFHQLWLPASDANLNTCKLRIPQECFQFFFNLTLRTGSRVQMTKSEVRTVHSLYLPHLCPFIPMELLYGSMSTIPVKLKA